MKGTNKIKFVCDQLNTATARSNLVQDTIICLGVSVSSLRWPDVGIKFYFQEDLKKPFQFAEKSRVGL
jgi:hypothetical protein